MQDNPKHSHFMHARGLHDRKSRNANVDRLKRRGAFDDNTVNQLSKRRKKAGWSAYNKMEITVVDEHNNVLLPIWRALKMSKIPSKGVKLMHFDSHPDMGCLDDDDEEICRSKLVPQIFAGKFNKKDVHEATCIGTYIPVLVLQGLVSEVTWVCGHWCDQMTPGSYDLVVGRCKKTGRMKMATKNDVKNSILDYWKSDGCAATTDELDCMRTWKLHVVKFGKSGRMTPANKAKLLSWYRTGEWILDIDEDYLSCNNPHGIEFRANFGDNTYKELARVFDADVKDYYEYWRRIEKITKENVYKMTKTQFLQSDSVQEVVEQLSHVRKEKKPVKGKNGKFLKPVMSKQLLGKRGAEELILAYRDICLKVFPKNVDPNKFNFEDIYCNEDIVETGEMTCVPHHITQAPEILNMINDTVELFCQIGRRPLLTTVATSRADRYLPDPQAAFINTLVLSMLRRQWPGARTTRTDIPENTADDLGLNHRKKPLLYRGKTPSGRRIPVSR